MTTLEPRPSQTSYRVLQHFPWLLLVVTWVLQFGLQQRMDAPAIWLEGGGSISTMADGVQDGDPLRRALLLGLGGIGAVLVWQARQRIRPKGWIMLLFTSHLTWALLSPIWSDDPALTLRREIAYSLTLLFAAGCVLRMGLDQLSVFIAVIPGLSLIPGIIAELRCGTFHPFSRASRFGGTVHPNLQAASLAMVIIVLSWSAWRAKHRLRIGLLSALLISFGFLLLTGSRTSIIALAIAIAGSILFVVLRDHRRILPQVISGLTLSAGIAGLVAIGASATGRSANLLNAIQTDRDQGDTSELTGRVDLWKTCLEFASDRPWLGYGFETFWSPARIEMISNELNWPINQSHSAYLEQMLGLGLPGACIYALLLLSLLVACIVRYFRGEGQYGPWAALLIFVIVHNATESINMLPTFPNFVFCLITMHFAMNSCRFNPKPYFSAIGE